MTRRADCTGPAQAGIKWLCRAGIDSAVFNDLKVTFDPKMHYSTCRFDISPSLAEKLPIPGGFANLEGAMLSVYSDPTKDNKFFGSIKQEANSCEREDHDQSMFSAAEIFLSAPDVRSLGNQRLTTECHGHYQICCLNQRCSPASELALGSSGFVSRSGRYAGMQPSASLYVVNRCCFLHLFLTSLTSAFVLDTF